MILINRRQAISRVSYGSGSDGGERDVKIREEDGGCEI